MRLFCPRTPNLFFALLGMLAVSLGFWASGMDFSNGHPLPPPHAKPPVTLSLSQWRTLFHKRFVSPKAFQTLFKIPALWQAGGTGQGQTIAFLEADMNPVPQHAWTTFNNVAHLPSQNIIHNVWLSPTPKHPKLTPDIQTEMMLDIEWAHIIAPKAHLLVIHTPMNTINDIVKGIQKARQSHANVVSISFGPGTESGWMTNRLWSPALAKISQLATKVPVFVSSGDYGPEPSGLAAVPSIVGVGGIAFPWQDAIHGLSLQSIIPDPGSGSGTSTGVYLRPSWQNAPGLHGMWRAYPDVSWLMSSVPVAIALHPHTTQWTMVGGTSLSAPLWAALWTALNQVHLKAFPHNPLPSSPNPLFYWAAQHHPHLFYSIGATRFNPTVGLGYPNVPAWVNWVRQHKMPQTPSPHPLSPFPVVVWGFFILLTLSTPFWLRREFGNLMVKMLTTWALFMLAALGFLIGSISDVTQVGIPGFPTASVLAITGLAVGSQLSQIGAGPPHE